MKRALAAFAALALVAAAFVLQPDLIKFKPIDLVSSNADSAQTPAGSTSSKAYDLTADGLVIDPENDLWHFSGVIERQAQRWLEDLGIEFEIVVANDLPGEIPAFATQLFEDRRTGEDAPTGGLLLVIDARQRRAFITQSYALEGAFPDALLGNIARNQLSQYASHEILGMAVMDVLHLLKDVAYMKAHSGDLALSAEALGHPAYENAAQYASGGGGALTKLSELPQHLDLKRELSDSERLDYAPSSDPLESIEALMRVQNDLVGDPSLELFTPGSQVQRDRYPFAVFEQTKRLESLRASQPLTLLRQGDRIAAISERPAHGFAPVLLHRIGGVDGVWKIDLVETWKNLGFDRYGNFREANANNPYHFALSRYGPGRDDDVRALDLGGRDPGAVLAALAQQEGALFRYMEGEVLFRNCFVFPAAIAAYEQAVAEAPRSIIFAERLAERAEHVNFVDLAVRAYGQAGPSKNLAWARAIARREQYEPAIKILRALLERNPFDEEVLRALAHPLKQVDADAERETAARLRRVLRSERAEFAPVTIQFDPPNPALDIGTPESIGEVLIYDHSYFGVDVTNTSERPVHIESIEITSHGDAHASRVGDASDQFAYSGPNRRIAPGQTVRLERTWGFTVDTDHKQVSYLFDYCWRGEGEMKSQCRYERVDTFPR